jgi:hypothetical protein
VLVLPTLCTVAAWSGSIYVGGLSVREGGVLFAVVSITNLCGHGHESGA